MFENSFTRLLRLHSNICLIPVGEELTKSVVRDFQSTVAGSFPSLENTICELMEALLALSKNFQALLLFLEVGIIVSSSLCMSLAAVVTFTISVLPQLSQRQLNGEEFSESLLRSLIAWRSLFVR